MFKNYNIIIIVFQENYCIDVIILDFQL